MAWQYLDTWLPAYLKGLLATPFKRSTLRPFHIMFLFVDHFELAGKAPRLSEWLTRYPILATRHRDADGMHPRHTWFYALDLFREEELSEMRNLVDKGLGEVELHWHHSHDSESRFRQDLEEGLARFQKLGFLCPHDTRKPASFAFIHGNWSLNNSGGAKFCGVNNEINVLKEMGCFADFTFPALYSVSQPSTINSIYYVPSNGLGKSYNTGREARVGVKETDHEFMIVEGPMTVNWRDWRFKWHPAIENGDINSDSHACPVRVNSWIRQRIGVIGRDDWIFVKVFCHGGQDYRSVLGEATDAMFSYLETAYNDGERYVLHYVTAREAYNIVKAAEDGKTGDPNQYRDYLIPGWTR